MNLFNNKQTTPGNVYGFRKEMDVLTENNPKQPTLFSGEKDRSPLYWKDKRERERDRDRDSARWVHSSSLGGGGLFKSNPPSFLSGGGGVGEEGLLGGSASGSFGKFKSMPKPLLR